MWQWWSNFEIPTMPMWYWLLVFTALGACVGSLLNVVIYRLPAGRSLWRPASACSKCGHRLRFWENIPILSWLLLRGRCRKCKTWISLQYPLIELLTAVLFGGLTYVFYAMDLRHGFYLTGYPENLSLTWPMLLVYLCLVACLLASTVIDFRYFVIPLQLPWFATVFAVIFPAVAILMGWLIPYSPLVPMVEWGGLGVAVGGLVGLAIAFVLLELGVIPRSFDSLLTEQEMSKLFRIIGPAQVTLSPKVSSDWLIFSQRDEVQNMYGTPEDWLSHPYPRREILKELLFVILPIIGMAAGWYAIHVIADVSEPLSPAWSAVGGAVMGYLIGGGIIWAIRIFGTLGFGKEAMGLGDVHLLAAIGACLGAVPSVFVFFVAPFFGIVGAIIGILMSVAFSKETRALPYGPYLAMGCLVVMIFIDPLLRYFHLQL